MNKNTFRCIGGPKHGELISLRAQHIEIPVWQMRPALYSRDEPMHPSDCCPPITVVRYGCRPIVLGPGGKIDVLVPEEMRDAEIFRRLADFIEGTTPPECHG